MKISRVAIVLTQLFFLTNAVSLTQDFTPSMSQFPCLSCLAKKYLCMCGTSVPSERLFRKGGYIVNPLRNRLFPEHVNILVL